MGEAKRRKQDAFSKAQLDQLERVVERAYKRTRTGIEAARAAATDAERGAHVSAIHEATGSIVGELTDDFFATDPTGPDVRKRIACSKGCSHCCHANVEVTIVEAIAVARRVAADDALAASVRASAPKVDGIPPWTRYDFRIPCPLLGKDGACSIYDARPRVCRAHVSYDVKLCEEVLTSGNSRALAPMVTFGWPRTVSKAIGQGTTGALDHERLQSCTVEMTAAVSLILHKPEVVPRWLRRETVFTPYGFSTLAAAAHDPHGM
jgi:Fe-S-cluster containining protein